MDQERIEFVFGPDIDVGGFDLTDEDDRSELLATAFPDDPDGARRIAHGAIAVQILDDDPPEVWHTAQRLRAVGLERDRSFSQLSMAFLTVLSDTFEDQQPFDLDRYRDELAALPLPDAGEIEDTLQRLIRETPGIDCDAAIDRTVRALGSDSDVARRLIERVLDELTDTWGPVTYASGDRLVDVPSLIAGKVFTHRLNQAEAEVGVINGRFDLWIQRRRTDLHLPDGSEISVHDFEPDGQLSWWSGSDWLAGCVEGSLVSIRIADDDTVEVTRLDDEPPLDAELVTWFGDAYERACADHAMPQTSEDVVVELLLEHPTAFGMPTVPLAELAAAAGLEVRGQHCADDPELWFDLARLRRWFRIWNRRPEDEDGGDDIVGVLRLAERLARPDAPDDDTRPLMPLREVFDVLDEPAALAMVLDELYFPPDDGLPTLDPTPFVDAMEAAASKGWQRALASLLRTVGLERLGDFDGAEQELQRAVAADPTYEPTTDRRAWYASLRGDATTATRLWRSLGSNRHEQDLAAMSEATAPRPHLGRNEPCWCGSGRKFKQCHLGRVELPSLPDRVGWLCRKAIGFLERRGGDVRHDVVDTATARATEPDELDSIIAALDDPLVLDLVLTEGMWFDRFLEEHGQLLPADEAILAASWLLIPRTVYEVETVRPEEGVTVRDLRTGERSDVTERAFTRTAHVGLMVCGRAVPDGRGHQFVGGLFVVPPGRESAVLDVLDEARADGDGTLIAEWVRERERPPVLVDRDGNVIDLGRLDLDDPDAGSRDADTGMLGLDDPENREILTQVQDQLERRWCDESVPALGGLTPREAANDPTRRGELERLLISFEQMPTPSGGAFGMRPERLKDLLGLP